MLKKYFQLDQLGTSVKQEVIAGFVVYPLKMIIAGRIKKVTVGMWVLFGFSVLFYAFYPY